MTSDAQATDTSSRGDDRWKQPRSGRGKFVTSMTTVQRDAEAARLRSMGWTFERIAQQLGMKNRSIAEKAVKRALDKVRAPAVEEYRKSQQIGLDRLKEAAFEVLESEHMAHGNGRLVERWDETQNKLVPVLDHGPRLDAIKTLIQVFAREAKLQGSDTQVKVEQETNGTVRIEIKGVDTDKL